MQIIPRKFLNLALPVSRFQVFSKTYLLYVKAAPWRMGQELLRVVLSIVNRKRDVLSDLSVLSDPEPMEIMTFKC